MSSPKRSGELRSLALLRSSMTLRMNCAPSVTFRNPGKLSILNVLGPKLSIPIPIFCKIDMFCSIQSASRGGSSNVCVMSNFCDGTPCSSMRRRSSSNRIRSCGMLIDQHESVCVFHQHVKFIEHANDLELFLLTRAWPQLFVRRWLLVGAIDLNR